MNCNWRHSEVKSIFKDANKRVGYAGGHNFFSTIYIAFEWAVSSFIYVTMKLNSTYANKFNCHGYLFSINLKI